MFSAAKPDATWVLHNTCHFPGKKERLLFLKRKTVKTEDSNPLIFFLNVYIFLVISEAEGWLVYWTIVSNFFRKPWGSFQTMLFLFLFFFSFSCFSSFFNDAIHVKCICQVLQSVGNALRECNNKQKTKWTGYSQTIVTVENRLFHRVYKPSSRWPIRILPQQRQDDVWTFHYLVFLCVSIAFLTSKLFSRVWFEWNHVFDAGLSCSSAFLRCEHLLHLLIHRFTLKERVSASRSSVCLSSFSQMVST